MSARRLESSVLSFRAFRLAALLACFAGNARIGWSQTIREDLWITDAPVYTVVQDGSTLYIGGSFTRVIPVTGGVARSTCRTGS